MSYQPIVGGLVETTDEKTGEVVSVPAAKVTIPGSMTAVSLDLPQHLGMEEWCAVGAGIQAVAKSSMWWLGDWALYGQRKWGDKFYQGAEEGQWSENTIDTARYVASRFSPNNRLSALSFRHHMVVASQPPEQATELLLMAQQLGWSSRDLAAEVRRRKQAKAIDAETVSSETCTVDDLKKLVEQGRRFGCVYADPPWLYDNQGTRAATGNHYGGMTVDELCDLPIRELAADDAHLHLWTTNGFLFECPRIFEAWGFEFRSSFVWCKSQIGIGNYWRNAHEFLLTGVRGKAKRFRSKSLKSWFESAVMVGANGKPQSWDETDRGAHSEKPENVRGMIERASPPGYLELFGRRQAQGWTVFGDQVERSLLFADPGEVPEEPPEARQIHLLAPDEAA